MKRPIRILKNSKGKLYIKNKKGSIVNIKTKLPRHIIQKVYVNIYDKHKTPIKRRRRKQKNIYRNRPVTDREGDSSYSSEKKPAPVGKDTIYLTDIEKEKQHKDLLAQNRKNTLTSQGIEHDSSAQAKPTSDDNGEQKTDGVETKSSKRGRGRPKGAKTQKLDRPENFMGLEKEWGLLSKSTQTFICGHASSRFDEDGVEIESDGEDPNEAGAKSMQVSRGNSEDEDTEFMSANGHSNIKPSELYPDESLMEDDIKEIIKKNDHVYCPVIAHDELDKIKVRSDGKPTFFIMNLSNRNSPSHGTHWVSVWVDNYDVCYFNSFGIPPDNKFKNLLIEYINKVEHPTLRKFKYNTKVTQDKDSSDCGYQCIKFIENMLSGDSFKTATNFTEKDVKELIGRGDMVEFV